MKKLNKIMLILSLLPTLLTSVFIFFMNDTVPMHYNASGAVDRYGSKYENFIFPAIILFMYAFYMVYTKIYTKYSTNSVEKINNNAKITAIHVTSIIAAFNILQLMFLILAVLNPDSTTFTDNVPFIINTVMGLMLIAGNFLPKTKRNSFIGVRTSWTKSSDLAWYESNRAGGIAFVVTGVLTIIESSFIKGINSTIIMVAILLISIAVAYIYAYIKVKKSA
jgi:uncharacterized membrane protein